MAGKPQYTDAEILWFVKQVFEYKIKNEDQVCEGFKERFGRELKSHQHKYLKGRYGRDPAYNCPAITGVAFLVRPPISDEAQLPILPLGQDLTVMSFHTMEVHGNVGQCLNSSQTMEGYGNVGQGLNSGQTMEGYGNVGQGLNGSSSGMAVANHYTTARYATANNTANNTANYIPRQTTEAPVPVPRQADLSGSSTMHRTSRISRSERRHRTARAAAYQQAQAAVYADEQVERQLQNRQQLRGTQQNFERMRMRGMPQPQFPANQNSMLWPQANISPSTQQAHFSHGGMHQAQGVTHQGVFASEQSHWTMNPYSSHQPPVADYPQQATYIGNHGQELSTQQWIETQQHYLQARQSATPVAYTGNHGQELQTGPWNGTQGPHFQEMEYSAPAAPGAVFGAPEPGSWEVAPQLGAPDLATVRRTEENQQEPGQGMQNPYERNGMPYPSPALSNGQLQQSMPLSHGDSQQSMPLSHREPQQSEPLSRGDSQQSMPLSYREPQQTAEYATLLQSEPLSRGDSQQSMPLSHREPQQSEPLSHREPQQSMPLSRGESEQIMSLSHREPQQSEPLSRGDSQQSMPLSHREPQQSEPLSRGDSQQSMPLSHREPQQSEPLSRGDSQQSMPLSHREPQQSEPLSRGDSQQSMPLSYREPQQSEPLSRGESQQSEPLSGGGQAAYGNSREHTPVRHVSPYSYQVIRIQHLQQLLAGTSNGTENAKEQGGEEDDFNFADFLNLENVP
ncbi:hypothetical protein BBO_03993 [Beauveria brongniartii RCEF 3172]|uniref:Uncharacterized protein n=1 Tax=Beauveria brongniartii RCEF 3172 TaxID=1081107 RepID=A0A162LTS3_9HYPO|nr:hypothetical protein BBO_03993 [Beauveria brongniartii RCEF 3172]